MKIAPRFLIRAAAILGAISLIPIAAEAAPTVSVEIKKVDTSPKPKPGVKPKLGAKEVEKNKLSINLRNGSTQDYKGLKVNYYFFSKNAGEPGIEILKQGSAPADLPPSKTATVESEEATVEFSPAYTDRKAGRIKAAGAKFAGHAVQVFNGDALVGEAFSSEQMKKVLAEKQKP